jgi:hypothetical protein
VRRAEPANLLPVIVRTSRSPAPNEGLARISASAGGLARLVWHHSAAISAPAACALSTIVSMPSVSCACRAAVSSQAKYSSNGAARLSWAGRPGSHRLRRSAI